jgi:hypothetical protein
MEAYCLKCRLKREMKDPIPVTMKNGKTAVQGACTVCGTKMYRIGRLAFGLMQNVPEDKVFWCADGQKIRNLAELITVFKDMSDDTFRHHVTTDKNDFSNWVKYVIGDENLSADLNKAHSPYQAAKYVESRINTIKVRR